MADELTKQPGVRRARCGRIPDSEGKETLRAVNSIVEMNVKHFAFGTIALGVLLMCSVFWLLFWPRKIPSKYERIRTAPGAQTVLMQIYFASLEYEMSEGRLPTSLNELVGITVRNSTGEKVEFSIKSLEHELGTNASVVRYSPQFGPLYTGQSNGEKVVLAYIPESSHYCWVIFRGRKIQRARITEVEKQISELKRLLEQASAGKEVR